jgi:hypothetical protein
MILTFDLTLWFSTLPLPFTAIPAILQAGVSRRWVMGASIRQTGGDVTVSSAARDPGS